MKQLLLVSFALIAPLAQSLSTEVIDLNVPQKVIQHGHLDLGGTAPDGSSIEVNSFYLERNGKPYFPIVAEFHFSRYPAQYWEESLRKLKAGGINTVATYVFWNLHEREEGSFDFSGNLNLRHFIDLCAKVDLPVIVRIGPFCHGEMRNGGIPDWMYGRPFEIRSNDPGYLVYVDRLYQSIARQLDGLYFKDGGPIIGIQLENEYQHSAAPWELTYPGAPRELTVADLNRSVTYIQISESAGENPFMEYGREHMKHLRETARKHGMVTPLYTATGWGNAAIVDGASLPVTAGYVYPFWAPAAPSPFYLFKDLHSSPDYSPVSYEPEKYPSIAAEIGPGIMPLYHRRPYFIEASLAPLMVRIVGSGSNGIGYYMYHGGSTPVFGHFFSEEISGLPKINYDFQAPIGEYGQVRSHFHSIKPLHFLLESFGEQLAPMQTVLPPNNSQIKPDTTGVLRYAVRVGEGSAFVFMHNFQDHLEYTDLENLSLRLDMNKESIRIPHEGTFSLRKDSWAILPVNMRLGEVNLRSATVQPFTLLNNGESIRHVFVSIAGMRPEMVFTGSPVVEGVAVKVSRKENTTIVSGFEDGPFEFTVGGEQILVLTSEMALKAYRVDDSFLVFSDALVLDRGGFLECLSKGNSKPEFLIYPSHSGILKTEGAEQIEMNAPLPSMDAFVLEFEEQTSAFSIEKISEGRFAARLDGEGLNGLHDAFLEIDYVGDLGMAFLRGQLVADHFYHAKTWQIGMRKFVERMADEPMILVFHPLKPDAAFLEEFNPDHKPQFGPDDEEILRFDSMEFIPEYQAYLSW